MLHPKVRLKLLASLRGKAIHPGSLAWHLESGFSLLMVIFVVLVLILGSVAIASLATSGLLGAALQFRNREARDVAEAGLANVISEFNKEQNRAILVAGNTPGSWTGSENNSAPGLDLQNPCTKWTEPSNGTFTKASNFTPPTATAINMANGTSQSIDTTHTYQVVSSSVAFSSLDRTAFTSGRPSGPFPIPDAINGTDKTLFRITVIGRVLSASGNELSRARVTKEYEVVPKCCKRSFGDNVSGGTTFGTDKRTCPYLAGAALGIIVGLNGGTSSGSNAVVPVTDENNNTITTAICSTTPATGSATNCTNGNQKIGKNISVVGYAVTVNPPGYPTSAQLGYTRTGGSAPYYTLPINTNTYNYIGVKSDGTLQGCTVNESSGALSGCQQISNTTSTTNRPCDVYTDTAGTYGVAGSKQYFCNLSQIQTTSGKKNIYFDTSNGRLNLFYPDTTVSSSFQYIDFQSSNSSIYNNFSTSASCQSAAGTTGSIACINSPSGVLPAQGGENLNFFVPQGGQGTFSFSGNTSGTFNIYAPSATVSMNGTGSNPAKFQGRIWTNNLSINGKPPIQVPNSAPTGNWFTVPSSLAGANANVDWIARSVTYVSAF